MGEGNTFIRVFVNGLMKDQRNSPVVLLKTEGGGEVLPIWIGHAEGLAIELHMKGETFDRPLTHDLLKATLMTLGASVAKVAITELRDSTFFAKIYIKRDSEICVIDARPSDSIALALKMDAPIFVSEEVFKTHKRFVDGGKQVKENTDEDLRRYLEDLDPGDF